MTLSDYVNIFGQHLLDRYGERVHKIAIDAGFTCSNRDGKWNVLNGIERELRLHGHRRGECAKDFLGSAGTRRIA